MPRIGKRIKKRFEGFLTKLAKENQKAFGNKRLDCCDLNRKNVDPDKQ